MSKKKISKLIDDENVIETKKEMKFFKSKYQLFSEFIIKYNKYQIYIGDKLLFDSELSKGNDLILNKNGFKLFDVEYKYDGISIKKK
jgi:hypothetical protein